MQRLWFLTFKRSKLGHDPNENVCNFTITLKKNETIIVAIIVNTVLTLRIVIKINRFNIK